MVWGRERRFWHFKTTLFIFSSVSAKVMLWVFIFRHKNSICCDGFRVDFFRFITKTRSWGRKINVFVFIKISSVIPIRRISSRYITRRRAIGTFNSFENIPRAGPNPKQRQRKSWGFSDQISQKLFILCTVALRNRHLSDITCRENFYPREGISSGVNCPFSNACME